MKRSERQTRPFENGQSLFCFVEFDVTHARKKRLLGNNMEYRTSWIKRVTIITSQMTKICKRLQIRRKKWLLLLEVVFPTIVKLSVQTMVVGDGRTEKDVDVVNMYQLFPPPKGHSARSICISGGETKVFSGMTPDKNSSRMPRFTVICEMKC